MSALADRPPNAKVGLALSHESADLHVTGAALYTQDLVGRTAGTLHAWPVTAPHAHALVAALDVEAAYEVPGVVKVLTAADVPGLNDAGERHDEPLFPSEVMFYGHAVVLGAGRDVGVGPPGGRGGARRLRTAAVPDHHRRRHCRRQLPGHRPHGAARPGRHRARVRHPPLQRRTGVRRAGTLLPRDPGRAGPGGRERSGLHSVEHPASVRDAGHRRPRARPGRARGDGAVPAHGWWLRRQGVPAARTGRRCRAGRPADRTSGQPATDARAGHDHDRKAAPVPGHLGGRLRRAVPAGRPARDADQQRRLEPGPLRAGTGAGAVPHRQRLLDPAHRGARTGGQDESGLQYRLPGLRRSAGNDRHRGHPGPVRTTAGYRRGRAATAQLLPTGPGHPLRPAGAPRRTVGRHLVNPQRTQRILRLGRRPSRGSTPTIRTSSAGWRSPRSSSASRST